MYQKNHSLFLLFFGTCLFAISALFYNFWHLFWGSHTISGDASDYIKNANLIIDNGLFKAPLGLRTYVYPLFLSLIIRTSSIFNTTLPVCTVIFQTLVYFFSIVMLYKSLEKKSKLFSSSIYAVLCLNFLFIPYLTITLTDALYTSLVILWFSSFFIFFDALNNKMNLKAQLVYSICLSFLAGLILETRPAGLWVVLVTAGILGFYGIRYLFKKPGIKPVILACSLFAFIIPLIPQIAINMIHYEHFTALPHIDLTQIHLAKISKSVLTLHFFTSKYYPDQSIFLIKYLNPFYFPTMEAQDSLMWYFKYPIQGIGTIVLKFIEQFDYAFLYPYNYSPNPSYSPYTRMISFMIFCLGLIGLGLYSNSKIENDKLILGPRYFPALCLFLWGGITCLSAPELRFGFPMLFLFIMLSLYALTKVLPFKKSLLFWTVIYFACVAQLCIYGNSLLQESLITVKAYDSRMLE